MTPRSFTLVALILPLACTRADPPPSPAAPDPPPSVAPSPPPAVVSVAPSASVSPPAAAELPVLAPKKVLPDLAHRVQRIEGALAVADSRRVGRIVGDRVEWLPGKMPAGSRELGERTIDAIDGSWPDAIGIVTTSSVARAPTPRWSPYTGPGVPHESAGLVRSIVGVARIGSSRLLLDVGDQNVQLRTVRGQPVARTLTLLADLGCPNNEKLYGPKNAAIDPFAVGSTRAGTLLVVGERCTKGAGAEVWAPGGEKSRIVDLTRWFRRDAWHAQVVAGTGSDEVWVLQDGVLLRFADGTFEQVPGPGPSVRNVFVSETGELHASAGRALWRRTGGEWIRIGRLPWPTRFREIGIESGAVWVSHEGSVQKLVPSEGIDAGAGCKTPFVHLSDVSSQAPPRYDFPVTRKMLAAFPGGADLELVEFEESGSRRLGAAVASKEQGEALVAHVRREAKEDDPALICYRPASPRVVGKKR